MTNREYPLTISDRQRVAEMIAVVATAAGKFIFMDWLNYRLPFILAAIIGWVLFVIIRKRRHPLVLSYWGFRTDNFRNSLKFVTPFAVASLVTMFVTGYLRDTLIISWHIIPILILYPLWGVIQQFLVIALVAGNLFDMKTFTMPRAVVVIVTAVLFGTLHLPFLWLAAGTFILALFYGYAYLRVRNLWVMGIFHGWLGAVFFYTNVGRDPFLEVFGPLF